MRAWLQSAIADEISSFAISQEPHTSWKAPLVGIADAHDTLFLRLKEVVQPRHALPGDLLPSARSVVAFFLPFDDAVPGSNYVGRYVSETWARAYVETNALIAAINRRLSAELADRSYRAACIPATHNFDAETLMSSWSHKHAAYIAGLGTFGLHHMLITPQGCAGRLGTLVTDAAILPTPRPTHEACLYKHNGTCGACVSRCVVTALTTSGDAFDRHACYALCLENGDRHAQFGLADVCGKCASGVPCSTSDPVANLRHQRNQLGSGYYAYTASPKFG